MLMLLILCLVALRVCNGAFPGIELTPDYDLHSRPTNGNPDVPLEVSFSIYLGSIFGIDEPTQSLSIEAIIRCAWKDDRIKFRHPNQTSKPYLLFSRNPVGKIWFPDMYIDMAKSIGIPSYKVPPEYLRVYPDGSLLFATKVTLELACYMDFSDYPVDTQRCEVMMESWGSEVKDVVYRWKREDNQVNSKIILNQHHLRVSFQEANIGIIREKYLTGQFTNLVMTLTLERKLSYHLLRTYLPSTLFVCLGMFSMLIPLEFLPGRVVMGMTALLTISTMFGTITSQTPPVSYTTKLDIWMVGCITFLFGALVEFTAVVLIKLYIYAPVPKPIQTETRIPIAEEKNASANHPSSIEDMGKRLARSIDKASLVGFFVTFLAFNVVYWTDIVSGDSQSSA